MESQIITLAVGILLLCADIVFLAVWIASLENEVTELRIKIREEYHQNSMRFMDLEHRIELYKMRSEKE